MRAIWITAVLLTGSVCITAQQSSPQHRLADSLQRKLDHIQENAKSAQPDPAPTVMTEDEINDYFAAGRVNLPQGVKNIRNTLSAATKNTFSTLRNTHSAGDH